MAVVDDAMRQNGWSAVSEITRDGDRLLRHYCDTAQKNYVLAIFNTVTGSCDIAKAEERAALEERKRKMIDEAEVALRKR